jgi:hypothetical protein
MVDNANPQLIHKPKPDPALRRLDGLVGTWKITGRTLDSKEDNYWNLPIQCLFRYGRDPGSLSVGR